MSFRSRATRLVAVVLAVYALLVYRVRGTPGSNDRVEVRCTPLFLFIREASHPSPHVAAASTQPGNRHASH